MNITAEKYVKEMVFNNIKWIKGFGAKKKK